MSRTIIAAALALTLAGCAEGFSIATADTTEARVIAACANERVKAWLPNLCADPVATARNAELAKKVLRVLVDLAL